VNIKIDVQRVGLNLYKSGLGSAYRTRVKWLEHGAVHLTRLQFLLARGRFGAVWRHPIITRSAESLSTLSKISTKIPAVATTAGVLYARTHTHTRALVAVIREALDIEDLEAGTLFYLYKIAHY
jgi:hypothetical protein